MGSEERVRVGRVGEQLRAAREAAGVPLEAICAETRVPMRHLLAIEEGKLATLPAAPYSVGFVRAYAQTLGMEAGELSRAFRAEFDHVEARRTRVAPRPFEPAPAARAVPIPAIVAALAALLLVIGVGLWWSGALFGGGTDSREALAGATDTPPAPVAAPSPAKPRHAKRAAKHPAVHAKKPAPAPAHPPHHHRHTGSAPATGPATVTPKVTAPPARAHGTAPKAAPTPPAAIPDATILDNGA